MDQVGDNLYKLVRENSEAYQTFIEFGGIMISGEAIRVGYLYIHEICSHLVTSVTLRYEIVHLWHFASSAVKRCMRLSMISFRELELAEERINIALWCNCLTVSKAAMRLLRELIDATKHNSSTLHCISKEKWEHQDRIYHRPGVYFLSTDCQ